MQPINRTALRALLVLLLAWPALAGAVTVGKVGVSRQGSGTLLKVATEGAAKPSVSVLDGNKALIVVPGGSRAAMAPLKVSSGVLKGIRFGTEGGDLRIVADLKGAASASLGKVSESGFEVLLSPASSASSTGAAGADAKADAGSEADVAALNPASAAYTYRIVDLSLGGDDEQGELVISSDGPASYKSSLKDDGKLLSLVFRNSSLAWSGDGAKLSDRSLSGVAVKQMSEGGESLVKVDLRLREKLAYNLKRDQNQLVVHFGRPEAEQAAPRRGDLRALVNVDVEDADVVGVLKALCQQAGFEYQFTKEILTKVPPESLVTLRVKQRPFEEVANTILAGVSCNFVQEGNSLYIGSTSEIADKRKRLPSVERFYEPKYLKLTQLNALLNAHFTREPQLRGVAFQDPTSSSRFMLVGTAQDVADVLAAIAKYDVPEAGEEAASDEGGSGGNATKTQVFHLQYLDPATNAALINGAIAQLYTDTGDTAPIPLLDVPTRTMVVTTQLKYLRKIDKLLARIDVKQEQVNIEGKIVEVNQGMSQQLGIDWTAQQQQASPNAQLAFNTGLPSDFTSQLQYTTLQNGFNISARIQALVGEHKADLVSAPNITTNDNQQATISTTDVQVSTNSTTVVTNGVVTTTSTFSSQSIPLTLKVTPKISKAERRVLMAIDFQLTSASGAAPSAGAPVPTSQQSAQTSVNVSSGETAVIGGLVRQSNVEQERKVPLLGDIPLLGLLFKFNTVAKEKKEVIIFITPSIVED